MMAQKRCFLWLLLASVVFLGCPLPLSAEKLSVSVPHFKLQEREKVIALTVTVSNASVVSLPKIPTGWSFNISNDPPWKTTVTGYMTHGVHGLDADQLDYLNDLLIVEPFDKKFDIRFDVPINIQVTIEAATDMENIRHVVYRKKDLSFRAVHRDRGARGRDSD